LSHFLFLGQMTYI